MSRLKRDAKLKSLSIAGGLLASCCLTVSLDAREVVTCKSPDGKFALRHVHADHQPFAGDTGIIEVATGKTVQPLDSNWEIGELKLLWSRDSQRVSYFANNTHFTENVGGCSTRVFFRNGSAFNEIKLPELPSPQLPSKAATESDKKTNRRVEPMEWLKTGDLVLESQMLNDAWGRAASKITIGFDQENRAAIRNVEQEKMSIVDYFLLLPADLFEGPPSVWLRHAQTGGHTYLCEAEPHEKNVDEKNGYMSCGGDGAQSSFDVALFRHRDGRPLLAVCHAGEPEVEEENSVYLYLSFFELGADGKMHEIKHSMLPGAREELGQGNREFVLPRQGRTILMRAPKSKKVLHKFTWNGEKFQEEK
jgi:hypothetical protein